MNENQSLVRSFWSRLFQDNPQLVTQIRAISEESDGLLLTTSTDGDIVLKCRLASPIGDHYMSEVFLLNATVVTSGQQYRAFSKILPSNEKLRELALTLEVNEKEVTMYDYLFPILRDVRQSRNNDISLSVSELYLSKRIEQNRQFHVILLEDLAGRGFRLADKMVGCSLEEAQLALSSLAQFHALSIAYIRETGIHKDITKVPQQLNFLADVETRTKLYLEFVVTGIDHHVGHLRMIGQPKAADFIEKLSRRLTDIAVHKSLSECGPVGCINHGDFWTNNLMFRYDNDNKPVEMMMVDWQASVFGHPSLDVVHFLLTSTNSEVKEKHFHSLLVHFYETLNRSLHSLGIDLTEENYSQQHFLLDVKEKLQWGILYTLVCLPLMLDSEIASNYKNGQNEADPEVHFVKGNLSKENLGELSLHTTSKIIADNPALSYRILKTVLSVMNIMGE